MWPPIGQGTRMPLAPKSRSASRALRLSPPSSASSFRCSPVQLTHPPLTPPPPNPWIPLAVLPNTRYATVAPMPTPLAPCSSPATANPRQVTYCAPKTSTPPYTPNAGADPPQPSDPATTEIGDVYSTDAQCTVHQGDWRQLFSQIPTESVDLTVTSPPYCIGKSYETTKTLDAFRDEHLAIIPKIVNITKPGGNICWQVGYHVTNAAVTPLDFIVHEIFSSFPEMVLRNRIIWAFNSGLHCTHRLSGRHEIVLWYSKGTPYHFDLDPIRLPQLYPGKKHHKGAKRGQLSGNPLGKNPGDVWAIPQVKASSVEKTEHPCQFPIGLVQGLIRALSPSGGLVLDPFLGSGTTGAAAALEGRRFAGAEIHHEYYSLAVQTIRRAIAGELRYRPYGKPLQTPAGSVARRPPEFTQFE